MMGRKAVIFDLDGVILDTVPLYYKACHRLFTEEGYFFDMRLFKEKIDARPTKEGIRGIIGNQEKGVFEDFAQRKQQYFLELLDKEEIFVFEDARELIMDLKRNNIKLAVASSSKNAKKLLHKVSLLNYFDEVITGQDVKRGKPYPDIFLMAASKLNIDGKDCVVLEDSIAGVRASKSAGIYTIGIARDKNKELLKEADKVLYDLYNMI